MFHVKRAAPGSKPGGGEVSRETPLCAEGFAALAGADEAALARLRLYLALLEKWQRRINLVAASTLVDPWRRHMLDSAQLLPLLPGTDSGGIRIADLGSGAGFPGLVLALLGGGDVTLIESDSRSAGAGRDGPDRGAGAARRRRGHGEGLRAAARTPRLRRPPPVSLRACPAAEGSRCGGGIDASGENVEDVGRSHAQHVTPLRPRDQAHRDPAAMTTARP